MATFRPGKPRVIRTLTGTQAAPTTPSTIAWDVDDLEGDLVLTPTAVEISIEGLYALDLFSGHTAGTSAQPATADIRRNGTTIAQGWSDASANARRTSCGAILELVPGDLIEAGSVGAYSGGKLVVADSRLTVVRIGPKRWTS